MNFKIDQFHKILLIFGAAGPGITYFIAVSSLNDSIKLIGLTLIAFTYFGVCVWAFKSFTNDQTKDSSPSENTSAEFADIINPEDHIETRLQALEDAREFFGTSLSSLDMFKLVSSRINEIIPLSASILLLSADDGTGLEPIHYDGKDSHILSSENADFSKSVSGLAFLSGESEIDPGLVLEKNARTQTSFNGLISSVAIPLEHEGVIFGIYQLFSKEEISSDLEMRELLNNIGMKISPLFLSARSVDRSKTSALVDPLTKLPNERALFMVLENQLAESQRFREDRALSVLVIDIKGFEVINREYGHASGDKILCFTAELIASKLRKMDFLVRSTDDEFLAVLPTANSKTANEILNRIIDGFKQTKFEISSGESFYIDINSGSATFWKDGETAEGLIRHARQSKQVAKSEAEGKVIKFSKEYIN